MADESADATERTFFMSHKIIKDRKEAEAEVSMKRYILPIAIAVVALVAIVAVLIAASGVKPEEKKPESEVKQYYADITIEDYGTITVKLDAQAAPISVNNFVKLAKAGFYDGLTFHRIIEGFMMQGGAPADSSKAADTIVGEFSANGYENNLKHTRGAISMARANEYNSASSQFFIVHQDSHHLDGDYAAFGYVTSGMDVVDKVCEDAKPTDGNGSIAKDEQPVIKSIKIRE